MVAPYRSVSVIMEIVNLYTALAFAETNEQTKLFLKPEERTFTIPFTPSKFIIVCRYSSLRTEFLENLLAPKSLKGASPSWLFKATFVPSARQNWKKSLLTFFSQVEACFMRCVLYYFLAIIGKGRVWSEGGCYRPRRMDNTLRHLQSSDHRWWRRQRKRHFKNEFTFFQLFRVYSNSLEM